MLFSSLFDVDLMIVHFWGSGQLSFGLASKCLVEFASNIGDITKQGSQCERFYLDPQRNDDGLPSPRPSPSLNLNLALTLTSPFPLAL